MQAHANLEKGMSDREADRLARVALGGFTQTNERAREVRPLQWLGGLVRDVRYTGRSLRRAPGFTAVAVLTIGLAIGACTAMYSVVHGVALQPLPYPAPDRLVHLFQVNKPGSRSNFSDPNFLDLRAASSSFTAVAEYSDGMTALVVGDEPMRVRVATVSRDFFDVFATAPALGRRFAEAELTDGGVPAVIVSDGFWRQHVGGRRDLSGATLRVRATIGAIVGVMPAGFDFPAGTDVWIPRELTASSPFRTGHNWRVVARINDGLGLPAAREESTAIARRLKAQHGEATWMTDVAVVPLHEEIVGSVRPVLLMLLASVGLLLVVASASLANLLLVRAVGRQRELAIRAALGAAGSSLMMPLAAEAIVLSAAGCLLGLALAYGAVRFITTTSLFSLPRLTEVTLSWPVLGFALGVTSATALSLGVLVAWRGRRPGIVEWLKDAQRGNTGGAALRRLRNVVVVTQLAVSVVLLVGAGLLGRSLSELLHQNLGFRTDGVLAVQTSIPRPAIRFTQAGLELADPSSLPRQIEFNERAVERLGALPGVTAAGGINGFPLGSGYSNGTFLVIRGDEPDTMRGLMPLMNDPSRSGSAQFRVASGGYFGAMGIPLVRGRVFDSRDTARALHVAVISESLARKQWPVDDPLGVRIQFGGMDGDMTPFTIVGIVGDIRERGLDSQPLPTFYADYRQRPLGTFDFNVVLQTSVDSALVIPAARRILSEMAPDMPPRFRTVREAIDASIASRRFTLGLTGVFAGAAMLLALLGVYGVLSYLVEQRRQEFGVRMALGARPSDVGRLVMKEAAWLVVVGLTLGVAGSLVAARVLDKVLFGVASTDVATYVGVTLALGVAALVAGQLPAMRATRVDPVKALHEA
jgi:predicted permease